MVRGSPAVIAALIALTLAASSGCAADHNAQPGRRSVSPTAVAPPVSASATTSPSGPLARPTRSPSNAVPPSPPASGSGIAGLIVTDGRCPVARAEPPCPDRPVAAHLNILDAATGTAVASVASDADGRFILPLKPGRYLLRPDRISGAPPHRPTPATVTVKPGQYTTVTIRFDSEIR